MKSNDISMQDAEQTGCQNDKPEEVSKKTLYNSFYHYLIQGDIKDSDSIKKAALLAYMKEHYKKIYQLAIDKGMSEGDFYESLIEDSALRGISEELGFKKNHGFYANEYVLDLFWDILGKNSFFKGTIAPYLTSSREKQLAQYVADKINEKRNNGEFVEEKYIKELILNQRDIFVAQSSSSLFTALPVDIKITAHDTTFDEKKYPLSKKM